MKKTIFNYFADVLVDDEIVTIKGEHDFKNGKNIITVDLPKGIILSIKGELPFAVKNRERIFINGYQSWTRTPEYKVTDKIKSIHLPQWAKDLSGADKYGDTFFVEYPEKRGILHGFSYAYFRDGEKFRLVGSLGEAAGYTMITYNHKDKKLYLERDCNSLHWNGGVYPAFELFFDTGAHDKVFDNWFDAMGVSPRKAPRLCGYSSWYNRYQNISEKTILDDLEGCKTILSPGDLFQIDDGWEPFVGDWLCADSKKFPNGMKEMSDTIHAAGYKAGLWLAPFVAQRKSELYKKHKDWFLKIDGKPWRDGYNWGSFYSLDIDNPEVVAYLEKVFDRVFGEWGFDLVKLDFLYAAAPFGTESETRAARMIRAVDLLRRVCGDKYIIGCGVPLMPAFGKFDYCRIGCDVGLTYKANFVMEKFSREGVSTEHAEENILYRRSLNGRAFASDPDVFFLRDENIKMSEKEKWELAKLCASNSGIMLTSDNPANYSEKARAQYKELRKIFESKG